MQKRNFFSKVCLKMEMDDSHFLERHGLKESNWIGYVVVACD